MARKNESYGSVFRLSHFGVTADKVLVQNKPTYLGEYVVPAGIMIQPGYGPYNSLESAIGRIAGVFKDTGGAVINGILRISAWDESDRPSEIVDEFDIAHLNQSSFNLQQPFAQKGYAVPEDKKLVLEIICFDSGKTFDVETSSLSMHVTKHKV